MKLEEALKDPNHSILDVRTPAEFENDGRLEESKNIPLQEVPKRLEEIKEMSRPLILCCRSGARSQQAMEYLEGLGHTDMVNGMGWADVMYAKKSIRG